MKKRFLLIGSFGILAFAFLFSCQEVDDITGKTDGTKNDTSLGQNGSKDVAFREDGDFDFADCTTYLGSITKTSGRLVFSDWESFEACAKCLEYLYDTHNNAFDSTYAESTAEELDSIAEAIGFDEWFTYERSSIRA